MRDNQRWEEEIELSRKAVEEINRLKPRFAVICGDLVHHLADLYPDTYDALRTKRRCDAVPAENEL
jgi:hypothetical protein